MVRTRSPARWPITTRTCRNSRWSTSGRSARSADLSLAPFELRPKHFEVAARRRPDQVQDAVRATDANFVALLRLHVRLAVKRHKDFVAVAHQGLDANRGLRRNHDR